MPPAVNVTASVSKLNLPDEQIFLPACVQPTRSVPASSASKYAEHLKASSRERRTVCPSHVRRFHPWPGELDCSDAERANESALGRSSASWTTSPRMLLKLGCKLTALVVLTRASSEEMETPGVPEQAEPVASSISLASIEPAAQNAGGTRDALYMDKRR